MAETIQQYTKRILGYIGGKDPLKVQAATPGKLARLIRGLSQKQLTRRPAPGKWSVAEILSHLAEGELIGGYRLRIILHRNGAPIQAYDQDRLAAVTSHAKLTAKESLDFFRTTRGWNLALYRSIPKKMWSYYGRHSERGKETVRRLSQMYAGHDLNHLLQIQRIRKGLRSRP